MIESARFPALTASTNIHRRTRVPHRSASRFRRLSYTWNSELVHLKLGWTREVFLAEIAFAQHALLFRRLHVKRFSPMLFKCLEALRDQKNVTRMASKSGKRQVVDNRRQPFCLIRVLSSKVAVQTTDGKAWARTKSSFFLKPGVSFKPDYLIWIIESERSMITLLS